MTIGERVREKRKCRGLTMAELGKKIGVSAAAISRYELGQRALTFETLELISNALNIHIFDLTGINETLEKYEVSYEVKSKNETPIPPEKMEEIEKILSLSAEEIYDFFPDEQKKEFWKIITESHGTSQAQSESNCARINIALDQMNEEGRSKVADYAEDILPRYRTTPAPQPPVEAPAPQSDGADTTPPPEGTEGHGEGK